MASTPGLDSFLAMAAHGGTHVQRALLALLHKLTGELCVFSGEPVVEHLSSRCLQLAASYSANTTRPEVANAGEGTDVAALASAGAIVIVTHIVLESHVAAVSDSAIAVINRFGCCGSAARQHLADVGAIFA